MKRKRIKKLVYEGLGFPIVLKNVPTIEVQGETIPDINYNLLQKTVLLSLCYKPTPLTGNEIQFIRKYFEITLVEFGKKFGYSHVAVIKWEKHANHFAKIEPTTDICIRLFVFSQLSNKSTAFKHLYDNFDVMQLVKYRNQSSVDLLAINLEEDTKMVI